MFARTKMTLPPDIKTPCPMRWDEMNGDAKTRFCDRCHLHVQHLSMMSGREAAQVLARSQTERVCVSYVRRADGTMVTRWSTICESVLGPFKHGLKWAIAACVPIVLGACETQTQSQGVGYATPSCAPQKKTADKAEVERVIYTGGI